jgi:hypothetical protein
MVKQLHPNAPSQPTAAKHAPWPQFCELRPMLRAVTAELSWEGSSASELHALRGGFAPTCLTEKQVFEHLQLKYVPPHRRIL